MHEFEETSGRFKINGYFYNLTNESTNKNKYYTCNKRCSAMKCRGSITITPGGIIVKKNEHSCNPLKNNNLPSGTESRQKKICATTKVRQYDKARGKKTKIDGQFYYFYYESKIKNKYYLCSKKGTIRKCRGSILVSPNGQVVKRVEHTCNKACHETNLTEIDTNNNSSTPKGSIDKKRDNSRSGICKHVKVEEIQEENTIPGSTTITPNLQIIKTVEHSSIKGSHNINKESFMSSEEVQGCYKTAKKEDFLRCSVILVDFKKHTK